MVSEVKAPVKFLMFQHDCVQLKQQLQHLVLSQICFVWQNGFADSNMGIQNHSYRPSLFF